MVIVSCWRITANMRLSTEQQHNYEICDSKNHLSACSTTIIRAPYSFVNVIDSFKIPSTGVITSWHVEANLECLYVVLDFKCKRTQI